MRLPPLKAPAIVHLELTIPDLDPQSSKLEGKLSIQVYEAAQLRSGQITLFRQIPKNDPKPLAACEVPLDCVMRAGEIRTWPFEIHLSHVKWGLSDFSEIGGRFGQRTQAIDEAVGVEIADFNWEVMIEGESNMGAFQQKREFPS